MKRIRLQVQILPVAQTRPVLKWCEPCFEGLTIQGLVDEILATWKSVYIGYGSMASKCACKVL